MDSKPERKTKDWSKKKLLAYSLVTGIIFILLIESAFRVICWFQFKPYHTDVYTEGSSRWVRNWALVWTNRPFYLEYDKRSQYNEVGMRVKAGDVFMPEKKENDFWVFLFGGSAMAGMGSNKDGAWFDITGVDDHSINESIDGYLETILQKAMPGKKVRVFNTAVSGHSVYQSRLRYEMLSKYKPDWVISMDGINDPKTVKDTETTVSYLMDQWKHNPTQCPPVSKSIFLSAHSAFMYKLDIFRYKRAEALRLAADIESQWKIRNTWLQYKPRDIGFAKADKSITNAADAFSDNLLLFQHMLNSHQQKYLLLVQPFIASRDTTRLSDTEKAVYNYFTSLTTEDTVDTYMRLIHERAKGDSLDGNIFSMDAVNKWQGSVFVDYCHFTKEANERIAGEISRFILSNGNYHPFRVDR